MEKKARMRFHPIRQEPWTRAASANRTRTEENQPKESGAVRTGTAWWFWAASSARWNWWPKLRHWEAFATQLIT